MVRIFLLGLISAFLLLSVAFAADGDFCIYREATAGDAITTTAANINWDTDEVSSSLCSINGGRTVVTLADAGHYLVMYSVPTVIAGNRRGLVQTWLRINNADIEYGRGTGFNRNSGGAFEGYAHGATIIDIAANDNVRLRGQRTDSQSTDPTRRANLSGIQFFKLDDSWDYIRARPSSDQTMNNNTTWLTLALGTNDEIDAGTFSRTGGSITLGSAGHYLVTYNIGIEQTSNTRVNYESRVLLDGTEIDGGRVTSYIRGNDNNREGTLTWSGIIETSSANEVLTIEARRYSSNNPSGENIDSTRTGVAIAKLPEDGQYIRLTEVGGGQDLATSTTAITWDTTDEEDVYILQHDDTNTERININYDEDYLFFHSLYADRVGTTTNSREEMFIQWRKNATTTLQYGGSGNYNRGSSNDAEISGSSIGTIFPSLVDTDYVEVIQINEANNNDSTYAANRMGVQGVCIASLFNSLPTDIGITSSSIEEENSVGDTVGTLSTTDSDGGDTHTYTLVSGTGDTDNASFSIGGAGSDELQIQVVGDFETKSSYSVRVRTDDGNCGVYEEVIPISIDDKIAVVTEVTAIGTTSDTTPDYTFNTTEAGTITYGGSCSSATTTATVGNNTVTFNTLAIGEYDDCTIKVTPTSNTLSVSTFDVIGTLNISIVDSGGTPVASPSVAFSAINVGFNDQTTTGTLGISSEKIRLENDTNEANWSVTIAAAAGETQWEDGANNFAYDDDSGGIQLEVQPSGGTITPLGGSSTTGTSLGPDAHFTGAISSITLFTCSGCDSYVSYDITGIGLEQDVPGLTGAGNYSLTMTLTIL